MTWNFHNPVRIISGEKCLAAIADYVAPTDTILIVTTPGSIKRGYVDHLMQYLRDAKTHIFSEVEANPSLAGLIAAQERYADAGVNKIIALGGGSALDSAKILSACLARREFSLTEHFANNAPLPRVLIPVIAIPTTSGTGSEVTPFATVWDMQQFKKLSLTGPQVYPALAILDASLTLDLPWAATLSTGLDAIVQAFESIWNHHANPICSALSLKAIRIGMDVLPQLKDNPRDLQMRGQMHEASLFAGLAISQTRTALCHSISYPLTAHFGLPHGLACAFTLWEVIKYNLAVDDGRFQEIVRALGLANSDALLLQINAFLERVGLASHIREYLPSLNRVLEFVPEMLTPGRSGNNIRIANFDEVTGIITRSWERLN